MYKILKYQIKNVSVLHLANDRPNYSGLQLLSAFLCLAVLDGSWVTVRMGQWVMGHSQ